MNGKSHKILNPIYEYKIANSMIRLNFGYVMMLFLRRFYPWKLFFLYICISPIQTFVNIPTLIRKRSVFSSSRTGTFTKVWIGDKVKGCEVVDKTIYEKSENKVSIWKNDEKVFYDKNIKNLTATFKVHTKLII